MQSKKRIIILLRLIIVILTHCSIHNAEAAETLNVAYGKISLIDLGTLIQNEPMLLDDSLVNIYTLSGLNEEDKKSVIAVQGLKKEGATDMSVRTASGIYQYHIVLSPNRRNDIITNPINSRTKIVNKPFSMSSNRMSLVSLPNHINEFVLAGNPEIIALKQVVNDDDPEFLKTFALVTGDKGGETDIVVASKSSVYKFTVDINNKDHTENISLYAR